MTCFLALNNEGSAAQPVGVCGGGGTNAAPIKIRKADTNVLDIRSRSTATSGTTRGIYFRHYIDGTSGECGRFYVTSNGAANDIHGVHNSVSFGASGTCTGEVAATRSTLEVPNATLGGTPTAVLAELNAAGTSTDASGPISLVRGTFSGDATGVAALEDKAGLFCIDGVTVGSGNICHASNATAELGIRCWINNVEYELLANAI